MSPQESAVGRGTHDPDDRPPGGAPTDRPRVLVLVFGRVGAAGRTGGDDPALLSPATEPARILATLALSPGCEARPRASSTSSAPAGVGSTLVKAHDTQGVARFELTVASVLTVALSWGLAHTLFTLRYAHPYYTSPVGGIDFKNDAPPDYQDFAYLAFTVGMTFQVSDTDVGKRSIRRTVLRHALVSYLFGVVIIAVLVNIVAGLL